MKFERICVVVLDSVGIGELPDAHFFGDSGANTLGHIAQQVPNIKLPNLQQLGLGNIASILPIKPAAQPAAYYGKMAEVSAGKDTMTGHWELMGLKVTTPFRTYPEGFPDELIKQFEQETGRTVIGNRAASGTQIIEELGAEQMRSGSWIVYTSADSVFQIAAHEEIIPLEELYDACRTARRLTMSEPHPVGRVIARPYVGVPGSFIRTPNRHDYAVKPPKKTVMNQLKEAGLNCIAIGKINDIFSGEGVTEALLTKSNEEGMEVTIETMGRPSFKGLIFTNLVDFDSLYGHRRDPQGYAKALEQFDRQLPELLKQFGPDDLLVITADHGNDPIHSGNDHTREYVPLLVWSPAFRQPESLGVRSTFADVAATIAENFALSGTGNGTSFLSQLKKHMEEEK